MRRAQFDYTTELSNLVTMGEILKIIGKSGRIQDANDTARFLMSEFNPRLIKLKMSLLDK